MNCPPAPAGGSSLSIMPARIYPHFDEFFYFAQFYWRESNFPERVDKYFTEFFNGNDIFSGSNPYELTKEEQQKLHDSAVLMAQLIASHRDIVSSMLNWRCIYSNPPRPD